MNVETLFIDTSAFYALMDRSDSRHSSARRLWTRFLKEEYDLKTSNYIVVETLALLQNRLGFEAADLWARDVLGVVGIIWINEMLHHLATEIWLSLGRRRLSLVDCASFVVMRHETVEKVFAYDRHFADQGFDVMK